MKWGGFFGSIYCTLNGFQGLASGQPLTSVMKVQETPGKHSKDKLGIPQNKSDSITMIFPGSVSWKSEDYKRS